MAGISKEACNIDAPDLLSPGLAFMVKGWNRCISFLGVCLAAFQDDSLLQARTDVLNVVYCC